VGIYSISDLAELTGVKTHTLRVWEKRYGLLTPQRTETNIRYYLDQDLKVLMMVLNLYNHGIRISRIAEMKVEEMEAESKRISKVEENDESRLLQCIADLDVTGVGNILDKNIRNKGFETTLMELILPVMDKMELMWLSGTIEEAHEACFRELIKRKTIREIDAAEHNCKGPKVIMFLPQGNHQELSHLFMHYFLRRQGLCITDMGCNISGECADYALRKCNVECVLIVNADPVHWQFGPFIKDLVTRTSLPIVLSGRAADDDWSQYGGQVIVIDSIEETIRFVSRLQENLQSHLS
jgi:MerR family transcriptional regulator, light-induced transcriptional regulator